MARVQCNGGDCTSDEIIITPVEYSWLKNLAMDFQKEIIQILYVVDEDEKDDFRVEIYLR